MQLEAQFDRLADSISLAKTKRRYIRATATRRRAAEPLPRPAEIAGGPMEEALYAVPKAQDFDPDPATRNRRWPRPALDYNTRVEVQGSLNAALQKLAKKRITPKKRKQMERIAATRRRQLARGEYFEAISAATLPTSSTATDTATRADPEHGHRRAPGADASILSSHGSLDATTRPPPEFFPPCPKDRPRASMCSSPR